jgi:hypothetical protein
MRLSHRGLQYWAMRRAVRLRRHHADRRTVHRKIAGKQPADFNEPVSDAVDGWLCVSGPPAANMRQGQSEHSRRRRARRVTVSQEEVHEDHTVPE